MTDREWTSSALEEAYASVGVTRICMLRNNLPDEIARFKMYEEQHAARVHWLEQQSGGIEMSFDAIDMALDEMAENPIQRYTLYSKEDGTGMNYAAFAAPEGEWCRASDVEKLVAEIERLREENNNLRQALQSLRLYLHSQGKRPEECYEMRLIDEALL